MKSLLLAAFVGATALAPDTTIATHRAPAPDFSGHWMLDAARSTGLPAWYSRIRSHELAVTQSDTALVVDVAIDAGREKPDSMAFVYRLDGVETRTTTPVRTPNGLVAVPTRLAAARAAGGIHITITREMTMGERTVTAVGTEDWELAADGKTLTVHRVDQMPQGGELRADMVFARK